MPEELAVANFFFAFQLASGLGLGADSFNVTIRSGIQSGDLSVCRDILHDMEVIAVPHL